MTRSVVAPATLRDPVAELALVACYCRTPSWLDRWDVGADVFTCIEARRLYAAAVTLHPRDAVTPATVCRAAGIAPSILDCDDLDMIRPAVPRLVQRLLRLHQLRRLHLLGRALAHRAVQPDADPDAIAAEVGALLDDVTAPVPAPRNRRFVAEVAA